MSMFITNKIEDMRAAWLRLTKSPEQLTQRMIGAAAAGNYVAYEKYLRARGYGDATTARDALLLATVHDHRSVIGTIINKSGGARMMESAFSLMQLAKTSGKLSQLADAKVPYISLCTDPTFGGTTASFAMLGDIICGEPGALIGFAGPRVIKETIKKDLPEGFQRSEFLLEHGFLDFIIPRKELKSKLAKLLVLLKN